MTDKTSPTAGRGRIDGRVALTLVVCFSVATFLFQAPFAQLNVDTSATLIRFWDLAYLLIALTGLAYLIRRRSAPGHTLPRLIVDYRDPLFWAIVLAAFAALSLIWAWIGYESSGFVAETTRVARLSVAIVLACLIRQVFADSRGRNLAPLAVIAFAAIAAIWAWLAWLLLTYDDGSSAFSVTRAGGPFGNQFANGASDHWWVSSAASNNLGFLLAVAFAVAVVWGIRSWRGGSRREAIVWGIASAVLVAGLVATHSRESVVAALTATIVVGGAMSNRTGWKLILTALGFGAAAMALLILVVPSFGDRFFESFNPGSFEYRTGPQARLESWVDGLKWGIERFPIGYGIGVIEEHPKDFGGATSENVFIQAWAQVGVVGLVALVALVVTAIRNTALAVRHSATLPTAFSLSFFTAFLVHGQFGNTLWDPTLLIVFGIALAFARPDSNEQPGTEADADEIS